MDYFQAVLQLLRKKSVYLQLLTVSEHQMAESLTSCSFPAKYIKKSDKQKPLTLDIIDTCKFTLKSTYFIEVHTFNSSGCRIRIKLLSSVCNNGQIPVAYCDYFNIWHKQQFCNLQPIWTKCIEFSRRYKKTEKYFKSRTSLFQSSTVQSIFPQPDFFCIKNIPLKVFLCFIFKSKILWHPLNGVSVCQLTLTSLWFIWWRCQYLRLHDVEW